MQMHTPYQTVSLAPGSPASCWRRCRSAQHSWFHPTLLQQTCGRRCAIQSDAHDQGTLTDTRLKHNTPTCRLHQLQSAHRLAGRLRACSADWRACPRPVIQSYLAGCPCWGPEYIWSISHNISIARRYTTTQRRRIQTNNASLRNNVPHTLDRRQAHY